MNERIKQLLDECTLSGFDKPWLLVDHEKFAKLIVQECLTIMDQKWSDGHEVAEAMNDIKEHFGLK